MKKFSKNLSRHMSILSISYIFTGLGTTLKRRLVMSLACVYYATAVTHFKGSKLYNNLFSAETRSNDIELDFNIFTFGLHVVH